MTKAVEYVDGFAKEHLEKSDFVNVELVEPVFSEFAAWQNVAYKTSQTKSIDANDTWFAVNAVVRKEGGEKVFGTREEFDNSPARAATALGVAAFNYLIEYATESEDSEKKEQAPINDT